MSKKLKFEQVKTFYKDVAEFIPEGAELERKASETSSIEAKENLVIEAVFSAPSTDRDGDIIYPLGCVSDYYTGTVIFNHDLSALPIGRCDDFQVTKEGVKGKIKLSDSYAFARDVYGLVREKILQGISIGFIPLEEVKRGNRAFDDFVKKAGLEKLITEATERIITKWEWIETSIVPIGCNRDALIYAMASKSFQPSDSQTEKLFGLDKVETKTLIDLQSKLIEKEQALNETREALEQLETKAASAQGQEVAIETKAPQAPNFADLSWTALVKLLKGQEDGLNTELNGIWEEVGPKIIGIDTENADMAEVSAQLTQILDDASQKADQATRQQVEKLADQIFAGYRTGYDGVTPIKEIEKVDQWRNDFVRDYMATLQPDPNKPLQAQTIETYKNDFLRAVQAEEPLPVFDMSQSNGVVAVQASFGAQQDITAALVAESGDLVQVKGMDDEKTCEVCAPALDQFFSVSGKSENFPSFQSLKDSGWGHIHCRCVVVPVADPTANEKRIKRIETKSIVEPVQEVKKVVVVKRLQINKPVLTDALRQKALALATGRLV